MYEIFEKLLIQKGVTPYKVSKATGIATATLSDWKNGRSIPKLDKLQKVADYFGVSVDYLMGLDKTIVPMSQTGGLSPEYLNVIIEARDKGYTPDDIKLALSLLDMARGVK